MGSGEIRMKRRETGLIRGATALMVAVFLGTTAMAQSSRLRNIELCNGGEGSSPDLQIEGCTALIGSPGEAPTNLAIAHNNRGNAYTVKQQYDLAIQDYDEALKIQPAYARAFNNRSEERRGGKE